MKNLEKFNVQALDMKEIKKTEGGFVLVPILIIVGKILIATLILNTLSSSNNNQTV